MRNPDPSTKRYTSLAWAAVLGHEETFEFLLSAGHDDEELSKVGRLSSRITIRLTQSYRTRRTIPFSCFWRTTNRPLRTHIRPTASI